MPLKDFESEFGAAAAAPRNAVRNGKIAHAYLLHCDDRRLSQSFSRALAQTLSCKSRSSDGDACGRCEICAKIADGSYPELFTLLPTSKSRKIKIGKDETEQDSVRWFQSLFYLTAAYESGKKIGIIMDADCMMPQAQNAFLKTLEEPPPDSYFIICTANPSELLPTFRSRCQRISILRNSQRYDFEEKESLLGILREISRGSPGLPLAEKASAGLCAVFDGLRQKAEAVVGAEWERTLENAKGLEAGARDSLDDRIEAAISSEYVMARERLMSMIHAYFFEKYQIAKGIDPDTVPNPELLDPTDIRDETKALQHLGKAEAFLNTMKLNVDEKLAIRAFCYSIVFP